MPPLSEIELLYPYAFLLLLVYAACERFCKKKSTTLYFSNTSMLESAQEQKKEYGKIVRLLAVALMIVALSTPITKKESIRNSDSGYEILLSIDASDSMRDNDRFLTAKKIVADFIDKRQADRLALSVFATFDYLVVPFTFDKEPLKQVLEYIELGVAGIEKTALYEALYKSGAHFADSKATNKIMILLTDGMDTKKNIELDIAINSAKSHDLKVYTVGIGKKNEYDAEVLGKIAHELGGNFYETNNTAKLQEIYDEIDRLEKSKIETTKITHITHYYQYPLALSFVLLLMYHLLRRRVA